MASITNRICPLFKYVFGQLSRDVQTINEEDEVCGMVFTVLWDFFFFLEAVQEHVYGGNICKWMLSCTDSKFNDLLKLWLLHAVVLFCSVNQPSCIVFKSWSIFKFSIDVPKIRASQQSLFYNIISMTITQYYWHVFLVSYSLTFFFQFEHWHSIHVLAILIHTIVKRHALFNDSIFCQFFNFSLLLIADKYIYISHVTLISNVNDLSIICTVGIPIPN